MFKQFEHGKVTSLACSYGKNVIDLREHKILDVDDSKYKRLLKTLGFTKLRYSDLAVCFGDLLVPCALKALEQVNCSASEVDAFIVVTQSHDNITPTTAFGIQSAIGLNNDCFLDDTIQGCAGFVMGLLKALTYVEHGIFKKVLVGVGDLTSWIPFKDIELAQDDHKIQEANALIFGDGAAVFLVEHTEESCPSYFNYKSDGQFAQVIDSFKHSNKREREYMAKHNVAPKLFSACNIDGAALADYVLGNTKEAILELLKHHNLSLDDLSYCLTHQGNKTLNSGLAMSLGSDLKKIPFLAGEVGNTSSASIPLMLATHQDQLLEIRNKPTMISGFGVGLCVYNGIVDFKDTVIAPVIEV